MKAMKKTLTSAGIGALLAVMGATAASATPITFTWSPNLAIPTLGGTPITADNIKVADFATITVGAGGAFTETGALAITDFQLGASTFTPVGLGTTYSLYYKFSGAGNQGGPIPTTPGATASGTYSSLDFTLFGINSPITCTATTGCTGTGIAEALAFGSLIPNTGFVTLQNTGGGLSPTSNVKVSFNPCTAAGMGNSTGTCSGNESLFFTSPSATTTVMQVGNFSATDSVVTTDGNGKVFINGGGGNITEALVPVTVPEPVTLSLFGAGLAGAAFIRRRRSKKA
jgi:hypothetical protein